VHELGELAEESFLRSGQRISIIGHSLGRLIGRSVALRYPRAIRHVITLGSPLMMRRGALPPNPQQGRLAMRFFHGASAFTFFCWALVSRPRLLEARVGSFDVIDLVSKNRRAASSNRFEQRRLSNPGAPERPNSRRIRPIRREHVRNELFLSKHAPKFPTCPTDRHSHASPGSRGAPPRSCLRSVLCCPTGSGAGRNGTGSRRPSLSATVASVAAAPAAANLRADARAGA
jgi:pimeloyl-ACP methyl ester carboxylesterase